MILMGAYLWQRKVFELEANNLFWKQFVLFCYENKLFASSSKTFHYQRYVDDIFSISTTERQSDQFFAVLKSLHPSLRFTVVKEKNGVLPFLDVKIE